MNKYNLIVMILILISLIFSGCSKGDIESVNNEENTQQSEGEGVSQQGTDNQDKENKQSDQQKEDEEEQNQEESTEANEAKINADELLTYIGDIRDALYEKFETPVYEGYGVENFGGGYIMTYENEDYNFSFESFDNNLVYKVSLRGNDTSTNTISLYDVELGSDINSLESRFGSPRTEKREDGKSVYTVNIYEDEKYIIECKSTDEKTISTITLISLELYNNSQDIDDMEGSDGYEGESQSFSLDSDILYHYLDGDIDFLFMKMGELPFTEEDEGKYYELNNEGYKTRYWLAEDDYTINRISIIKDLEYYSSEEGYLGDETYASRFMGIWFDMTLEEAAKNVTNIPTWNSDMFDLRVEYSDYEGDNKIYRIDVYSNKTVSINIKEEDFYLQWLGANMELEADHLGDGPFDTPEPFINAEEQVFTYEMVKGPDKWFKDYYYDDNLSIESIKIRTEIDSNFKGTVPSLLGVRLNMELDKINSAITEENNTIENENAYQSNDGEYLTKEYIVTDNEKQIVYVMKINVHNSSNLVKNIEIKEKPVAEQKEDYSLEFLENDIKEISKLDTGNFSSNSPQIDTSNKVYEYQVINGSDKWIKKYYYDKDNKINSIKISLDSNSSIIDIVPSLLGIKLNMNTRVINNVFANNNYEIGSEEFQDSEDGQFHGKRYMVYHSETHAAYNVEIKISNTTELVNSIEVFTWRP